MVDTKMGNLQDCSFSGWTYLEMVFDFGGWRNKMTKQVFVEYYDKEKVISGMCELVKIDHHCHSKFSHDNYFNS